MTLTNLSGRQKAGILTGVLISMFLAALDQTIVGTALPKIVADLNGSTLLAWVVSAYLLASAVSVPIMSKLSDIYGRRTLYFVNIFLFLLGSALCGLSQNMGQLIAFRVLQGLGGGFLLASAFTIIGDIFPPRERGKWAGLVGASFGLASVVGPTLGGFLTDKISWRAVFYVNIPVGVIAIIALILTLPNIKRDDHGQIDWLGAGTLVVVTIPLLLALLQAHSGNGVATAGSFAWGSLTQLSLFALSAIGIAAFIFAERRAHDPIVPLWLFKNRNFLLSNLITFLTAGALFGGVVYIPIFIQSVIGSSATGSGLVLLPFTAGTLVASISTGQIVSRTGKYKLVGIAGLVLITIAMVLLASINGQTGNGTIIRDMVILGLGLGVTFPLFTSIVQNEFEARQIGVVTGALTFFRTVGGAVGTAVLGTIYNSTLSHQLSMIPHQNLPAKVVSTFSNPNVLQSASNVNKIKSSLPIVFQNAAAEFIRGAHNAIAYSIAHVFIFGIVVGIIGFVLMNFIQENPLRETHESIPLADKAALHVS
jgi:EmrB/QacA subfamily drug resistance transporter